MLSKFDYKVRPVKLVYTKCMLNLSNNNYDACTKYKLLRIAFIFEPLARFLMKFLTYTLLTILCSVSNINMMAQPANKSVPLPPLQSASNKWIDSIYNSLSLDQKIGQLFMVAAYSGGEKYNEPQIEKLIKENGIGGVIFMQGTAKAQAEQTNKYQQSSKVPMLIAMDAEWGLGMRLKGIQDMPRQLMMGAMKDSTIVYKMATAIAAQCRRLGVHIDFAPVVDVNNNPNNPVINFRSFGENKYKVANYALQYMRGLQDNGIMACAKHFPGHGDTDVDSHKDLPEIPKSLKDMKSLELFPFQKMIDNGIQSVMIAHLKVPSVEPNTKLPTTLSYNTVTALLKNDMRFNGLIFTDALNMEGVAKYYQPGEVDYKAFIAGNDVLLFSQDVPSGVKKIKEALNSGKIPMSRIEESIRKILKAKYDAGLAQFTPIDIVNIDDDINQYTSTLRSSVAEHAITLLSDNYNNINKLKTANKNDVVYVSIGSTTETTITAELKRLGYKHFEYVAPTSDKEINAIVSNLKKYKHLLIGMHNMSGYPTQNFGIDNWELKALQTLSKQENAITVLFGNPYAAKKICDAGTLFIAYDEANETQKVMARILNAQLKAKGTLPVTVCENFKYGDGIVSLTSTLGEINENSRFGKQNRDTDTIQKQKRIFDNDKKLLCCVSPEAVGANNKELDKLDDFLERCVITGAMPGCRVLASKEGNVFYDKAFGKLSPSSKNYVDINTIYDLASITKVAATTLAIMKLYDQGKIDLYSTLGNYLPRTKGTDKEYLKIKDILLHQAGLKSWIPFYKETLDSLKKPRSDIYSSREQGKFNIKVAQNLYMRNDWIDTMWKRILYSPLENRGRYVYSDLDFIFLQKVVERVSQKSLDEYVRDEFYKPLGLKNTGYQPNKTMSGKEIAPTEYDDYFRYGVVQGYVHDMAAAMFGGISGHAGLFSSATDLAVIFQMLLNGGIYEGKRYLKPSTVELFTSKSSSISRRALGFDKPEGASGKGNPCSDNTPLKAFGHQGFTGTCVWADPENDIVFIFLSNRTYPSAEGKTFRSMNVRENAQRYVYNAFGIAPRLRK